MSELLNRILDPGNLYGAYQKVCANKGASGIDGVTVDELRGYIKKNWSTIEEQIRQRHYKPQPVRRVEIPKPQGGIRKIGIPTVMDRVIQQAIVQVLTPICEPLFSEYSYGFRPDRNCEMAIVKAMEYMNEGYEWIVDIDLEKFFDNVPQDKLMTLVGKAIHDGDTESLIRKYLQTGVMTRQGFEPSERGAAQGGPLSPLLSNIMLNELDRELEKRGLHFTRYADDCIILVRTESAAKRVMQSITGWIERKLDLKVNVEKTHITKPWKLKYLGFGFYKDKKTGQWKCRPHQDSLAKFRNKLKQLTQRNIPGTMESKVIRINQVIRGWINYYSLASMKTVMADIDAHLRTRIRVLIWKQWKVPSKRQRGLQRLGIDKDLARRTAYCGDRYQWVVTKTCVPRAISKAALEKYLNLVSCLDYYTERHALKMI